MLYIRGANKPTCACEFFRCSVVSWHAHARKIANGRGNEQQLFGGHVRGICHRNGNTIRDPARPKNNQVASVLQETGMALSLITKRHGLLCLTRLQKAKFPSTLTFCLLCPKGRTARQQQLKNVRFFLYFLFFLRFHAGGCPSHPPMSPLKRSRLHISWRKPRRSSTKRGTSTHRTRASQKLYRHGVFSHVGSPYVCTSPPPMRDLLQKVLLCSRFSAVQ